MQLSHKLEADTIFPVCRSLLPQELWEKMVGTGDEFEPDKFPNTLALQSGNPGIPKYIADLARLERTLYKIGHNSPEFSSWEIDKIIANPNLDLLELNWKNLCSLLTREEKAPIKPEPGREMVMVWKPPGSERPKAQTAAYDDLLALKIVVEEIDPETAAVSGFPATAVDRAIDQAILKGILLSPPSRIRRNPSLFSTDAIIDERFLSAEVFTLQWHITQACDLHCKHCYDRSSRKAIPLQKALDILDSFHSFCRERHVWGQVSFTGGNPLLYPHFTELYQRASEQGFSLAILGNPASRETIEELLAIEQPVFYQVSLEGLQDHNDAIRGPGHFERVIDFLDILRELDVFSMVMLTLTQDNMEQVIPLAEYLQGRTDSFTFNRLSMVGEGANLKPADREKFARFLESYMEAAQENPIMHLKDNLFNILHTQKGLEPVGGCTGFGCGAAFNFLTLLPDGQVHACRKFPSPLGNILKKDLAAIYDSDKAEQYRQGCMSCRSCTIRPVCGGCLANAHSFGLNIFEEHDPYCFMLQ